jgi:hypothetical protein
MLKILSSLQCKILLYVTYCMWCLSSGFAVVFYMFLVLFTYSNIVIIFSFLYLFLPVFLNVALY